MKKTDIAVIGAGIAGLSAAIYLSRVNANFVLLEKGEPGGKLNILKDVENFPAAGKTSGKAILSDLINQINHLGIKITKGNVQTILKDKDGFNVVTDVDSYLVKKIIVAIGNGNKNATIPGEEKYFGAGVSYCAVCDANFFKNLDVAVIGNNDIALEETAYLAGIVKKVYLLIPSGICGDFELINKVKTLQNVDILENTRVLEIVGNQYAVSGVLTGNGEISVSAVFPYIGEKSATQILKNISPKMNGDYAVVDENMKSNIDGLYFAGDIVDKKLKQLITASSDGAIAAVNVSKVNI